MKMSIIRVICVNICTRDKGISLLGSWLKFIHSVNSSLTLVIKNSDRKLNSDIAL